MMSSLWLILGLTPLIGVLLFLACINLFDKIIYKKSRIKEQTLLCAVLVFIFVGLLLFSLIAVVETTNSL